MNRCIKNLAWVVITLCLVGCTKDPLVPNEGTDAVRGELVEVKMNFQVETPFTVEQTRSAETTGATAPRVVSDERSGAMRVRVIETPANQTKAMDENAIKDVWVFQYDGAERTAKLRYKKYYASYTPNMKFELLKGDNQRIVAVVNQENDIWGNGMEVGTATYAEVLERAGWLDNPPDYAECLYMSGTTIGSPKIGTVIECPLRRNMALVTMKVIIDPELRSQTEQCGLSFVNVMPYCAMVDIEDVSLLYPATEQEGATWEVLKATPVDWSNPIYTHSEYLPVNYRGIVKGTTAYTRRTNADKFATYMKIHLIGPAYNLNYYYYFGTGTQEDYTLRQDHRYNYEVTLYPPDPSGVDSRVEREAKNMEELIDPNTGQGKDGVLYLGMFGGDLVREGNRWHFTKALGVSTQVNLDLNDQEMMPWIKGHLLEWTQDQAGWRADNFMTDGKANTWRLLQQYKKALDSEDLSLNLAANTCMRMNTDYEMLYSAMGVNEVKKNPNYAWYLPASEQLAVMYMMNQFVGYYAERLDREGDEELNKYWSSTMTSTSRWSSSISEFYVVYQNLITGQMYGYSNEPGSNFPAGDEYGVQSPMDENAPLRVRCVKEW